MANRIIDDGSLSVLDIRLITTSTRPLGKVNNPPSRAMLKTALHSSAGIAPARHRSGVLTLIRERVRKMPMIVKRVKRLSGDGVAH